MGGGGGGGLLMFMTASLGSAGVVGCLSGRTMPGGLDGGLEDARGARGGPRESSLQLGHSPTKAKQANFPRTDYLSTQT